MYTTAVTDARVVTKPQPSTEPPVTIVAEKENNETEIPDTIVQSTRFRSDFISGERYSERAFLHDKLEYPRNGSDQGLVVIFNQTFKSVFEGQRKGSQRDVVELVITLGRLGYNIEEKYIFEDLDRGKTLDQIKKIVEEDHSQRNCVIVAFFTHGNEDDKLETEHGHLEAHEIWKPFADSKYFKNKPKMFLLQACKGHGAAKLVKDNVEKEFTIIPKNIFTSNLPPDMLIVYASVEGYVSYRNPEQGSWFIQELCKNFHAYGRRDDVISLITRTSKCVATYYVRENSVVTKQMPMFVSTLKKKFYLTKSKDMHATLTIKQNHDDILQRLDALSKRIEELEHKNAA